MKIFDFQIPEFRALRSHFVIESRLTKWRIKELWFSICDNSSSSSLISRTRKVFQILKIVLSSKGKNHRRDIKYLGVIPLMGGASYTVLSRSHRKQLHSPMHIFLRTRTIDYHSYIARYVTEIGLKLSLTVFIYQKKTVKFNIRRIVNCKNTKVLRTE